MPRNHVQAEKGTWKSGHDQHCCRKRSSCRRVTHTLRRGHSKLGMISIVIASSYCGATYFLRREHGKAVMISIVEKSSCRVITHSLSREHDKGGHGQHRSSKLMPQDHAQAEKGTLQNGHDQHCIRDPSHKITHILRT